MLNDFFINTILIIAFTFIIGHILKDIPQDLVNSLYGKILLGVFGGLLGILLMVYTLNVDGTTTLLDLRVFAIMMVSFIGGTIPTIVAGIIIGLYRIAYFGLSISSIIAMVHIILYIICFHIINKMFTGELKKWFFKTLISFCILMITFFYLLRGIDNYHVILFNFSLVIILVGVLEYFLLEYVRSSNELYRRYKKESSRDFLTGLYNRRHFDKMLNLAFKTALENKFNLSCLMIDIDHFKKVNDTYGHTMGDIVIRELSDILVNNCRTFDIIGRVGGEEFCILLVNSSKEHSIDLAYRIRKAVREHKINIGEDNRIKITVSIGVASYPDTSPNLNDLKEMADIALYNAKHSGRDKVCENYNF